MGARKAKANYRRMVLRLPDLDHSKSAVLNRLPSPGSRRVYQYAIEQFTVWYCSERAWLSIALYSSAIACTLRHAAWPRTPSASNSLLFGGWHTKRLMRGKQLGFRSGNWLSLDQSSEIDWPI